MEFSRHELEAMAASATWFHSIDLGQGVVTSGTRTAPELAKAAEVMRLPDVRGKSVLDVNAWDGYFSFEAERRGAARVVALDHYMWAMHQDQHSAYYRECMERGVAPAPYHTMPYYDPATMPGRKGFDTARRALHSKVEDVVGDFMDMDLAPLGTFDVVLYFGSLYHMRHPLLALERLAAVTGEVALIETEAVEFPGYGRRAFCEFFEKDELNGDVSNWWAPNEKALAGLCRAAGFSRVEVIQGAPRQFSARGMRSTAAGVFRRMQGRDRGALTVRYRAVVHAFK
jgi:tRNA (mo5U34)-methyltransferase